MNLETIIKLFHKAGAHNLYYQDPSAAQNVALLIAEAEREACAKLLNENANFCSVSLRLILESNAEAIRARGQA